MSQTAPVMAGALPLPCCGSRPGLRAACHANAAVAVALGHDPVIPENDGRDAKALAAFMQGRGRSRRAGRCTAGASRIVPGGKLVGIERRHSPVENDRRGQVAIGLPGAASPGHHSATKTLRLALDHAFRSFGLHRASHRALADRIRPIRCQLRPGIVAEGRERWAARVPGGRTDDPVMALRASVGQGAGG